MLLLADSSGCFGSCRHSRFTGSPTSFSEVSQRWHTGASGCIIDKRYRRHLPTQPAAHSRAVRLLARDGLIGLKSAPVPVFVEFNWVLGNRAGHRTEIKLGRVTLPLLIRQLLDSIAMCSSAGQVSCSVMASTPYDRQEKPSCNCVQLPLSLYPHPYCFPPRTPIRSPQTTIFLRMCHLILSNLH